MSLGINQCNFGGYLGKDPELTTTDAGINRVSFSMAVTETWKDKSGEKQEHTEWLSVQAWRKQAELIAQYFSKGDPIFITGKYRTREYEDKNGQTQRHRYIELERFHFLPSTKPSPEQGVRNDDIPF